MIFKRIGNGRPYPDHGRESTRQWADVAPRPVRLDQLVTTKGQLDLETLLAPYLRRGADDAPDGARRVRLLAYFLPDATQ